MSEQSAAVPPKTSNTASENRNVHSPYDPVWKGYEHPKPPSRAWWITLVILIVLVAQTFVRIEYLNYRAGTMLPNGWYRTEGDPSSGHITWRTETPTERRFREKQSVIHDTKIFTGPLTESERVEFDAYMAKETYENNLYTAVASWGLLQYIILPALCFVWLFGVRRVPERWRWIVRIIPSVVIGLAFWSLLYREYFPSLGF